MPFWDAIAETYSDLPLWLREGGKGSAPLQSRLVTVSGLLRARGAGRVGRDEDIGAILQKWFFKLAPPTTTARGDNPLRSTWTTAEGLRRGHRWASWDYSLRKVMDDWFFGASSTYGETVKRSPLQIGGWGGQLRLQFITRKALTKEHRFGTANLETPVDIAGLFYLPATFGAYLKMLLEDWFFGRTPRSETMHILFTRRYYP